MSFSRWLRPLCAVLLMVCVFTARIGAVSHCAFVEPIQNHISKKAIFQDDDRRQKTSLFKGKRTIPELPPGDTLVLIVPPTLVGYLLPRDQVEVLPEVYLEIFDPPDNHRA
ncbi:MAG: hypothetical protein IH614_17445 [Desulfuromonadales bacterium]|nr:hypothetical protein [Desulfuromonadales bacterium]